MRTFANLLSKPLGFASVVFILLTAVGGGLQAWAQDCPSSPAYTPDFSSNQLCLTLNSYSVNGSGTGSTTFTGEYPDPVFLQLTNSSGNQTGSAWYSTPQAVDSGFTTNFQFQFTNPSTTPADGITFVIQNASTGAIGYTHGNGGALGYGDADGSTDPSTGAGIPNSLAIEFDVYQNAWDLAGSHVAVQSCGTGPNTSHHNQACGGDGPLNSTWGPQVLTSSNLADGNVHTVTIKYSAASPANIHVIVDGTDMYPGGVSVDLGTLLSLTEGKAYVGFTGATGGSFETQSILSWTFSPTPAAPEATYTTPSQPTSQGGSNQFTDPGGSGTNQTYVFPTTTDFSCASNPSMAIQFQYWDPTVFNSTRLPGIPQNPNWCSVPGNPGLACSTPVPPQTTCAQLSVNGKNYCIVEEAQCSCGGTQQAHCNVTGGSGPILVSNANNNYASPAPVNPGLVIGDDGQNNWAIMPQSPDGSTCTTSCTTQKLNTDITILDVNQPDFSFSASPTTLNIGVGGSATSTVSMSGLYDFALPVTLSVSGAPTGVTATMNPTITPNLSTSPTSSTLTVSLGPSVMPGSFTLDVNGVNGSLNHYAFVTVNVVVDTTSISNLVTILLNSGCIDNAGIANALTSKLSAAQGYINAGDNQDAINTLTAFNNQVNAQNGKHIHSTCPGWSSSPASVLTSDASSLITTLRVGMMADPITGYVVNSSGAGIQGATVSIFGTTTITATTDVTGFYYFATTGGVLSTGQIYTMKVTGFPTGYSTASPTYSTFTWSGSGFATTFTLNP
ncbi:MAG TPA: L-type lectin-domain containing protein [Candidatus Sulfotelmatobacter sp.]|nr:L-type lectin-domain containing protein [Candidatus Sulfotelmatobacter sp.]